MVSDRPQLFVAVGADDLVHDRRAGVAPLEGLQALQDFVRGTSDEGRDRGGRGVGRMARRAVRRELSSTGIRRGLGVGETREQAQNGEGKLAGHGFLQWLAGRDDMSEQYSGAQAALEGNAGLMSGRREVLKAGAGAGIWAVLTAAGLVAPAFAAAHDDTAFAATSLDAALQALGAREARDSDGIRIGLPDVAEDGRAVPVTVSSELPATERIVVLIEDNPYPLAANFRLSPAMRPEIQTRVRMARSTRVHVIVKAEGGLFAARRDIKVTVGGCGV